MFLVCLIQSSLSSIFSFPIMSKSKESVVQVDEIEVIPQEDAEASEEIPTKRRKVQPNTNTIKSYFFLLRKVSEKFIMQNANNSQEHATIKTLQAVSRSLEGIDVGRTLETATLISKITSHRPDVMPQSSSRLSPQQPTSSEKSSNHNNQSFQPTRAISSSALVSCPTAKPPVTAPIPPVTTFKTVPFPIASSKAHILTKPLSSKVEALPPATVRRMDFIITNISAFLFGNLELSDYFYPLNRKGKVDRNHLRMFFNERFFRCFQCNSDVRLQTFEPL